MCSRSGACSFRTHFVLTAAAAAIAAVCLLCVTDSGVKVFANKSSCCALVTGAFSEGCSNYTTPVPCWVVDSYYPNRSCRRSSDIAVCSRGACPYCLYPCVYVCNSPIAALWLSIKLISACGSCSASLLRGAGEPVPQCVAAAVSVCVLDVSRLQGSDVYVRDRPAVLTYFTAACRLGRVCF